jgi:hypothetical protein
VSPSVPLVEALLALSALLAVLAGATAARKGQRALWTRRRARLEEAARPHLLAVLAGEPPHEPRDLPAPVGKVFEELAISFLPKLRGSDRETLVSILVQRDALARARRRATRPGAVGRARAAELLGAAGDQHALPVLTRLLADRDPEVRTVAARALGKLGAPAVAPLLAALERAGRSRQAWSRWRWFTPARAARRP